MQSKEYSCVVLGGGGFLGINLCRRLIASGHQVRAFGRRGLFPGALAGVDIRHGDFSNRDAVADALRGVETAFHLIHSTVPHSANLDIARDVRENLLQSISFLDLARDAGVKRIVFLSSGGTIYGRQLQIPSTEAASTDPITAYGISKLAIEKYLALYRELYDLDYRILRVANPFGPFQIATKKQGLIAETISRALSRRTVEVWGDGSVVRDFVYVDDVTEALEMAGSHMGQDRLFNIGSGSGRSVREVLVAIEQAVGLKLDVTWMPGRHVDIPVSILAVKRARESLGWVPKTTFESGIASTVAWWKDNADLIEATNRQLVGKDRN